MSLSVFSIKLKVPLKKLKYFHIKSYNYLIQSNINTITPIQTLAFTAALG